MSIFKNEVLSHLGDNEWKQRRDIENLRDQLGSVEDAWDVIIQNRRTIDELEQRLERTQAICEALVELAVEDGWVEAEELANLIDQFEQEAHPEGRSESPDRQETVTCGKCGESVAKSETYMTSMGARCGSCYVG